MEKKLFLKALNTLFYSWGGDPAPECYWAANDFLDYFEKVNNVSLGIRFEEPYDGNNYQDNNQEVFSKIESL